MGESLDEILVEVLGEPKEHPLVELAETIFRADEFKAVADMARLLYAATKVQELSSYDLNKQVGGMEFFANYLHTYVLDEDLRDEEMTNSQILLTALLALADGEPAAAAVRE